MSHLTNSLREGLKALALTLFLVTSGCATKLIPREPSEFLYTTKLSTSSLFTEMSSELEKNKYRVKKKDVSAGVFVTQPRKFSFDNKEGKVKGEQILQLRQEGGSIKLRIAYKCTYPKSEGAGSCNAADEETNTKVHKVERALLKTLEPIFALRRSDLSGRKNVDISSDQENKSAADVKKPTEDPANKTEKSDEEDSAGDFEEDWGDADDE